MSDQVDSQVANEDKSASQADLSQQQSGETQPGNLPAGAALAELALKDPEAAEIIRRKNQSEKDKGVDKALKQSQQVRDDLEAFAKAVGVDLSKVSEYRRNKMLDEMYQERYGNSQGVPGGEQGAEAQPLASSTNPVDLAAVKAANPDLDFNDEAVLRAYSKHANDQDGFLLELGKIRLAKTGKPQAGPTEAVTSGSGSPISTDANTALRQAYDSRVAELKKQNRGVVPPGLLADLKSEYRKKGLNIW